MRDFPEFITRFFFPHLFLMVPLLLFFGFGGAVNLLRDVAGPGWVMVVVALLPWVAIFVAFYSLRLTTSMKRVRWTFFVAQNVVVLASVFPFFSTIDGVSLATVAETSGSVGLLAARGLRASVPVMIFAQIFIWPWTMLLSRRWKRWMDPTAAVIEVEGSPSTT